MAKVEVKHLIGIKARATAPLCCLMAATRPKNGPPVTYREARGPRASGIPGHLQVQPRGHRRAAGPERGFHGAPARTQRVPPPAAKAVSRRLTTGIKPPSSLQTGAAADQPPKPPNIPPPTSTRLPSNIPLRTLPSRADGDRDRDAFDSQSASLLSARGYGAPHHRPSSESETSSWTDTGDIGDQYADDNDPVRIQLPADIEDELLASVHRRQSKPLYKQHKK
ncbi:uncharacterized protein TRIREDRAFT_107445, partial [Trichoderma reesei QM6a]